MSNELGYFFTFSYLRAANFAVGIACVARCVDGSFFSVADLGIAGMAERINGCAFSYLLAASFALGIACVACFGAGSILSVFNFGFAGMVGRINIAVFLTANRANSLLCAGSCAAAVSSLGIL